MPVKDVDIVNTALFMIGDRNPLVTGVAPTFDQSAGGKAAAQLYVPSVQTVGRMFEWDMARSTIGLTLSGNAAPLPWGLEYLYPTNGIEVWQLFSAAILADPNNPVPVNWASGNAIVTATQRKVIWTDATLPNALAVYNNNPGPDVWDAGFRECVEYFLASKFAEAVAGKPQTAKDMMSAAMSLVQIMTGRED